MTPPPHEQNHESHRAHGEGQHAGTDRSPTHKCPICGNAVTAQAKSFPFCSPRCRKIDLGKWLSEDYKVSRPIEEQDLDEE